MTGRMSHRRRWWLSATSVMSGSRCGCGTSADEFRALLRLHGFIDGGAGICRYFDGFVGRRHRVSNGGTVKLSWASVFYFQLFYLYSLPTCVNMNCPESGQSGRTERLYIMIQAVEAQTETPAGKKRVRRTALQIFTDQKDGHAARIVAIKEQIVQLQEDLLDAERTEENFIDSARAALGL